MSMTQQAAKRYRPRSVVMVTPLYAPHIGGVERHVEQLVRVLSAAGVDICIITQRHAADVPAYETNEHCEVIRFGSGRESARRGWRVWLPAWQCLWHHRSKIRGATIVHCHDAGQLVTWWLPMSWLFHKRPLVTFHGFDRYPVPYMLRMLRRMAEIVARGHICVGHFLHKWYGTHQDLVTYGAVEAPDPRLVNQDMDVDFVYVGRFAEDTQALDYVRAIQLLYDRQRVFSLVLYGDGPLRVQIEALVAAHPAPITLLGPTTTPLAARARGRYAFASGYLAILESLSLTRLVFALYGNPLKRDYLSMIPRSADMLVLCNGVDDLAEQVLWFSEHPEDVVTKTQAGQAWAQQQTWPALADLYLTLWQRAIPRYLKADRQ